MPHGRVMVKDKRDKGAWGEIPEKTIRAWKHLEQDFKRITDATPKLEKTNNINHLEPLELEITSLKCVSMRPIECGSCCIPVLVVWATQLAHASSNLQKTNAEMVNQSADQNLAYFPEGTDHFGDYVFAVEWAQKFARMNREIMMMHTIEAIRKIIPKPFEAQLEAINCHHNYVTRENHYGENIFVTRKGAVRVRAIWGLFRSMGARSFIVRGLGNEESFVVVLTVPGV